MSTPVRSKPKLRLVLHDPAATGSLLGRVVAVAIGIALGAAFLALQPNVGSSLFSASWSSTLGSALGISQLTQLATPLILAGCAVAVAARVGLWNIGVDGQLILGAWAATAVGFYAPDAIPGAPLVVLMMLAALLGGALWMVVPALAYAYARVNVVVTTLMLNFVAYLWLAYWITGPWSDPSYASLGLSSQPVPDRASLPHFTVGSIEIGVAFLVAVAVAVLLWAVFRFTHHGFRTAMAGADEQVASYGGVNVGRLHLQALLVSGAIGGLVGVIVELDRVHRFSSSLSDNTGYLGIVVAALAAHSFAGATLMGFLIAILSATGGALSISGVSSSVVLLLIGILLLMGAFADVPARYRLLRAGAEEPQE
jgi:simple sugar transport system permease protein